MRGSAERRAQALFEALSPFQREMGQSESGVDRFSASAHVPWWAHVSCTEATAKYSKVKILMHTLQHVRA